MQQTINAQQNDRHMLSILATTAVDKLRTASMQGTEFTIIPCVALVEGVLWPANAPEPELALAEEFGRITAAWNGRPIIMNHPMKNGVPVSAGDTEILDTLCFGYIFNTELKDNALHTELWINNARVKALGGEIEETVDRLVSGQETVDVSVGLFSRNENIPGVYNGKKYSAIWRNIVPDHLAVLSKGVPGACSVADGCGAPRINGAASMEPVMKAARMEAPADKTEPPVIKAACGCEGPKAAAKADTEKEYKGIFARLKEHITQMSFKFRGNTAISDQDIRRGLQIALNKKFDSYYWIVAIFQEAAGSGTVVYEDYDGMLLQRTFSITSDGGVSLGESATEVRPETQFVPVTINAGESNVVQSAQETEMTKQERVAALIANKATKFTNEDTDFLMTLEESQLAKLEPVVAEAAPAPAPAPTPEPVTLESYLAAAPAEVKTVINSAIQLQQNHRKALIDGIKANSRNSFTEAQLNAFDLPTLENLAALAEVHDYSGAGIGAGTRMTANAGNDDDDNVAPVGDFFKALHAKDVTVQ